MRVGADGRPGPGRTKRGFSLSQQVRQRAIGEAGHGEKKVHGRSIREILARENYLLLTSY